MTLWDVIFFRECKRVQNKEAIKQIKIILNFNQTLEVEPPGRIKRIVQDV